MAISQETRKLRGQLGAIKRHHPDVDRSSIERELATARLADYIGEVLAAAPPLTGQQRARLTSLLSESGQ